MQWELTGKFYQQFFDYTAALATDGKTVVMSGTASDYCNGVAFYDCKNNCCI